MSGNKVKVSSLLFTTADTNRYQTDFDVIDIDNFEGDGTIFTAEDIITTHGKHLNSNNWIYSKTVNLSYHNSLTATKYTLVERDRKKATRMLKALKPGTTVDIPHLAALFNFNHMMYGLNGVMSERALKRKGDTVSFKYSKKKPQRRQIQSYYENLMKRTVDAVEIMLKPLRGYMKYDGSNVRVKTIASLKQLVSIKQVVDTTKADKWLDPFNKQDRQYLRKLFKDPASTLLEKGMIVVDNTP